MPFAGTSATGSTFALLIEAAVARGRHPFRYLADPELFLKTRIAVTIRGAE